MRRSRSRKSQSANTLMIPVIMLLGVVFLVTTRARSLDIMCSLGFGAAAVGVWYFGARRQLATLHRWGSISNMYALSPEGFEQHVASTYQALGYTVSLTKRVGDQGIDVLAVRGSERIGVQCKRSNEPTSNSAVQEAYAGKAHYRCTQAAVVALGGFTSSARALANSTRVELFDGSSYANMFHRASAALPSRSVWSVVPARQTLLRAAFCGAASIIALAIAA